METTPAALGILLGTPQLFPHSPALSCPQTAEFGHVQAEISQGGDPAGCSWLPPTLGSGLSHVREPQESPRTLITSALQTRWHPTSAHPNLGLPGTPSSVPRAGRTHAFGGDGIPAAVRPALPAPDPPRLASPRQAVGRGLGLGSAAWRSGAA